MHESSSASQLLALALMIIIATCSLSFQYFLHTIFLFLLAICRRCSLTLEHFKQLSNGSEDTDQLQSMLELDFDPSVLRESIILICLWCIFGGADTECP